MVMSLCFGSVMRRDLGTVKIGPFLDGDLSLSLRMVSPCWPETGNRFPYRTDETIGALIWNSVGVYLSPILQNGQLLLMIWDRVNVFLLDSWKQALWNSLCVIVHYPWQWSVLVDSRPGISFYNENSSCETVFIFDSTPVNYGEARVELNVCCLA